MQHNWRPWWTTEHYDIEAHMPPVFEDLAGPQGIALVRTWPDGTTDPGWGLRPTKKSKEGFMPRYMRGEFNPRRVLFGFDKNKWAYAFIMRSLQVVCIDIDGKNGGLEHVRRLWPLPRTISEVSKSGNGYHLFYSVEQDWDPVTGFAQLSDRLGIEQGVDFRSTGCVYHYPSQRWGRTHSQLAPLPDHVKELLLHKEQVSAANQARFASVIQDQDDMEVLMLQHELLTDLKKKIPPGSRNNTLFAIGSKMKQADVPNWDEHIRVRAEEVGLDTSEIEKLVSNIETYA